MIRIDLQPRVVRYRWLGVALGLALAIAAFGAALYTFDQEVSLHAAWARWIAPEAVPITRPAVPEAPAVDVRIQPTPYASDLPLSSQAVARSLALMDRLTTSIVTRTLRVSGTSVSGSGTSGGFIIEGQLDTAATLSRVVESLRGHAIELQGTKWFSDTTGDMHCRLTGKVVSPAGVEMTPVTATEAARQFTLAEAQAVASGLQSVQAGSSQTTALVNGLSLHRVELTAVGYFKSLTRFVQYVADHPATVRLAHLVVVGSTIAGSYSHFTLSLDAVVRASLSGDSR
jgi:hypothetical protein